MPDIDLLVRQGYLKTQDEIFVLIQSIRESQGLVEDVLNEVLFSDYAEENKKVFIAFSVESHKAMDALCAMNTQLCKWALSAAKDAEFNGEDVGSSGEDSKE